LRAPIGQEGAFFGRAIDILFSIVIRQALLPAGVRRIKRRDLAAQTRGGAVSGGIDVLPLRRLADGAPDPGRRLHGLA
jgi:hypothetical protein